MPCNQPLDFTHRRVKPYKAATLFVDARDPDMTHPAIAVTGIRVIGRNHIFALWWRVVRDVSPTVPQIQCFSHANHHITNRSTRAGGHVGLRMRVKRARRVTSVVRRTLLNVLTMNSIAFHAQRLAVFRPNCVILTSFSWFVADRTQLPRSWVMRCVPSLVLRLVHCVTKSTWPTV